MFCISGFFILAGKKSMIFIQLAALSGFLSVAFGAFGAHALKSKLNPDMLAVYKTAVEYQFVHTLALLLVGVLLQQWSKSFALHVSALSFTVGIIIFSGSLYILSLSGVRWLGAITPIGGLAFLIGWISLFIAAYKAN
jgi:uncharacterized membrane protein YgdD (TMEM256/DUF423 family)